jgi:hypothetical protein
MSLSEGSLPAAVDFTEVRFHLSSVLARRRNLYKRRVLGCFMEERNISNGLRSLSQSLRRLARASETRRTECR